MFVARCARSCPPSKNVAGLLLSQRITRTHGNPVTISTTHPLALPKGIHTLSEQRTSTVEQVQSAGFVSRMLKKIGIFDMQKEISIGLGIRVYEDVMKQVDFPFFFKHFNMPDTFFSWFLVTELHVWMIMVRYMSDETYGKVVRNSAVKTMWEDTEARVNNLGIIRSKIKNEQIQEISHQFNAAIIGYDEGIQSDDKTLAGALWRRFFQLECNNPEHVETLLIYVRKQICLFDNLPNHEVFKRPVLKLVDIKSLCKHE